MPVSRKRPSASAVELQGRCDRDPREVLLLELIAEPFLGLGGLEPGTEVFPGRGTDLQRLEGRAWNRPPFEIEDPVR